jgi:hypothetical protein
MSRRHHGRPHHPARPKSGEAQRPMNGPAGPTTSSTPGGPAGSSSATPAATGQQNGEPRSGERRASAVGGRAGTGAGPRTPGNDGPGEASIVTPRLAERTRPPLDDAARFAAHVEGRRAPTAVAVESAPERPAPPVGAPAGRRPPGPGPGPSNGSHRDAANGCTAPQLRRFIKSRPYVPMHELRRRFAIDGDDDDVTPVPLGHGAIYVGLPEREGRLLGELVRGGEVGYELSLDPRTPIVIGVYPMRPVPRA